MDCDVVTDFVSLRGVILFYEFCSFCLFIAACAWALSARVWAFILIVAVSVLALELLFLCIVFVVR